MGSPDAMNHCQNPSNVKFSAGPYGLGLELKPVCLVAGVALIALGVWLLASAWAVGNTPLLINALLGCLIPGTGLLYRGLFRVNDLLTMGYLLIWMFLAGVARSLEEPDTLLTAHMLVGCGLFLLPGLVLLRIAAWEATEDHNPGTDSRFWNRESPDPVEREPADTPSEERPHAQQRRREPPEPTAASRRADCLRVLGLEEDVPMMMIRAAYRREMARYHPDRVAHLGPELVALAERKAAEINQAYDYLVRRRR